LTEAFSNSGVARVDLGVNAANAAAIALYEGAGFQRFGLERDFMRVDGVSQDELHMVRERVGRPAGAQFAGGPTPG
jgi:RimJ/RimL family protein N-acetyltransferase